MNDEKKTQLRKSALLMRILGWLLVAGLIPMVFIYPPGFMWGAAPEGVPSIGPAHPPSPYDGLHPYLYMLGALYVAYGILLIRGAQNPRRNVALFVFGILSSVLHGLVMVPQSFMARLIAGYIAAQKIIGWADPPRVSDFDAMSSMPSMVIGEESAQSPDFCVQFQGVCPLATPDEFSNKGLISPLSHPAVGNRWRR